MKQRTRLLAEDAPNRLREWRQRRQLTLDDVAKAVGSYAQNLQRLETGRTQLRVHQLEALARILKVEPADLLRSTDTGRHAQERRLLELFRMLSPTDRSRLLRVAESFALPTENAVA